MAKKGEPRSEEDLKKLKLPPIPPPESKTEEDEKTEPEAIELEEVPEEETKNEKGRRQMGWAPKDVEALIRLGMEWLGTNLADKYLAYKKVDVEARRRYFESVSTHNRRMIYVLIAFLTGIVAFMSVLTTYEKVSGDALLFLVGTITGYIIISVQRLVFPSEEPPPTEETPT